MAGRMCADRCLTQVPIVVEFVPDAKKDELLVNLHLEG